MPSAASRSPRPRVALAGSCSALVYVHVMRSIQSYIAVQTLSGLGPCRWGTSAHADHAALLDADHAHQGLRLAPWRCTQKEQKKATEDSPTRSLYANNLIQGLDIIVRQILYRGFSIIGNRFRILSIIGNLFRKTNRGSPAACSLSACYCLLGAVSCWTARLLSPKELGSNVMGWAVSLGGLYRLL